jgi:nuclear pore complex protein Nup98-Nup96
LTSGEPTGLTPTVSFSPSLVEHEKSKRSATTPSNISRLAQSPESEINTTHFSMSESVSRVENINENTINMPKNSVSIEAISPGSWLNRSSESEKKSPSTERNHPPTLSKSEYFSNPDIRLLQQMSDMELKNIPKFSVFRPGVGRIEWEGDTDVRGLDLDKIVKIEGNAVDVYENLSDTEKPPVGQKLNKSAIILLHNIFPKANASAKKRKEFIDKLRKCCEDSSSEFLDYDPVAGDWVFRVFHFSRYGLGDFK